MARAVRRILLAGLALVALALFALWRIDNPRIKTLRMATADALSPVLTTVSAPLVDVAALLRDWERLRAVHAQNRELRREIQRLRAWRDAAEALERENARLRALNNVRLSPRIGFATGEVVADAGGPFGQSVLVNIGARDGVADGAAAVDGAGLVGRVVGVGDAVARVLLLSDPSSRVPVKILPGGQRAVLVGDASAAPRLAFLAEAAEVALGDQVVTSGDGGVFPPDLDIGAIAALDRRAARVRLAADYAKLEFLRILRWRPETPLDAPSALILPPSAQIFETPPLGGSGARGLR